MIINKLALARPVITSYSIHYTKLYDMRRILGASRVRKAFIGLHYVREMDRERRDGVEETPVDMKRLRALAMARYMQTLGAAKPA